MRGTRKNNGEPRREVRTMMWGSAFVLTSLAFMMLLPGTHACEAELASIMPRTVQHTPPIITLETDCQNGGVGFGGKCICPRFVTGAHCENAGACHSHTDNRFTLSNHFTKKPLFSINSCEIDPALACCWRGKLTNLVSNITDVQSLLEFYGPWTPNDKVMLSYLFGSQEHLGSMEIIPPPSLSQVHHPEQHVTNANGLGDSRSLAFVIMVHSEFMVRLPRMLSAIYRKRHTYMIHVDKSVDDNTWNWAQRYIHEFSLEKGANNIHLVKNRFRGAWGGVSLVYQELACIIELLKLERSGKAGKFSHVINLSAFDFPIKPVEKLEGFLKMHEHMNFIEVLREDVRREQRQKELFMPCNRSQVAVNYSDNEACPAGVSNWMFKHRPNWVYGEGSQWHFLSHAFAEYLVSSWEAVEMLFSFKFTLVPDEAFFQTALLNSPYESNLNTYNYRYLPWSDGLEVLRKHIPLLKETDALFIRKVLDLSLYDELERELLTTPN